MSIRAFLESRHVWFEVLLHCPAATATRRARRLHVPGRSVAKVVLVVAEGGGVLVVLPATHWIDLEELARVLGVDGVRLANEDEVGRIFDDCERGALPPFGRLYGLKTVVDASLAERGDFIFVGNLRHEGIRMRYRDYEAVEAPIRARIA